MTNKNRCYILIGDEQNWKIAIQKKIWGFQERSKGLWNTTQIDDFLAFYVTKPFKSIIGFGMVKTKFINDKIIWNDERFHKRALWLYKISFDVLHVCNNWDDGISLPKNTFLQVSRKVIAEKFFLKLVKESDEKWNTNIISKIKIK